MSTIPTGVPRAAQLQTSPTIITWVSGQYFNGYVWLGVEVPNGYSQLTLTNSYVPQQLPRYIKVPIINGTIDTTTGVPWTSDIDPPGTNYVAYFCDNNNAVIAPTSGSASPFSVAGSTYTINVPTLTMPSYSGQVPPTPQISASANI